LPDHAEFIKTLYDSYFDYVPDGYGGHVLVFVAKTQALLRLRQVGAAWKKIAPSSEVFEISGTHDSIMEMQHVAERLSEMIEEVIGRTD
jgi:hypothetical protein